ncbi:PLP-dependent aminotransferase family protein [uncultured Bifidobacterium sp.]|uniref:aminotransferase-like domain-containing protein n=1 Tax=uncultured Bifidobacterium sp. TaxID=165187 RepID=UPI0028DC679A|nr:PLP-dependent aminotransferase family protein [uncultured Bifidobacterium sp.]
MRLTLNRGDATPLYLQIVRELRILILGGSLAAGYRLPSERALATALGVNRSTVVQAYERLRGDGLIASAVGQGTFVSGRTPEDATHTGVRPARSATPASEFRRGVRPRRLGPTEAVLSAHPSAPSEQTGVARTDTPHPTAGSPHSGPGATPPPWAILFSDYSNRFTFHDIATADLAQNPRGAIDFATGSPNPHDIPDGLLREASSAAFASHAFDDMPESPIAGFDELRDLLARHMGERAVRCDRENVMVLSGSEQGIDLCVRTFVNPGDVVLVEQSTFFPALQAFRTAQARVVGVPMDDEGMRTDLLEGYCSRYHPKLIYTIPTFQNPTGSTLPCSRRRDLVETAMRHGCLVVEDDPYDDLCFEGESPIPLAGMENAGYVISLSTFSKTVAPGLRTGWMVADRHVIRRLTALRRMIDQHTSSSSQRICMELLRGGDVARHVARLVTVYRERRDLMIRALERDAPRGMRWTIPRGGYYLWVRLPDGVRTERLLDAARSHGVTFMPGEVFDADGRDEGHIRLNFARPDTDEVEPGISALCRAVTTIRRDR